ncbi:cupin domain-containing protein [Massilia sp. ST3]|uniref:cupin domain-containing protein n=1 Tax=Massilia sp. ST3 TaxID=2824903 RepID=UPI001B8397AE|nr:cupin domain-containing protein [Massilia sp. ST3]MBQ5949991.1 cupin domain-containing protein [Massilia sp. ST3]
MSHLHLKNTADHLPHFWQSAIVGHAGNSNIKVLKMDGQAYPAETHDYAEALVVIEGKMFLSVHDEPVVVAGGEMVLVPPGVPHAVAEGSHGTLMIIDPAGC